MQIQATDMPRADAMESQAHLYAKMADDLRAQAAKLRYCGVHPEKTGIEIDTGVAPAGATATAK